MIHRPPVVRSNKRFLSWLEGRPWIMIVLIILLACAIKAWLLITGRFPFNSDEAVVGLMALHISHGEMPIFFYGQAYMGSLDAYLVSLAFMIFGKNVSSIRIIQLLLYSATILTTYRITFRMTGRVVPGWIAALLLAIPAVNSTLYTTISLGGYGEALLIGNLIILVADRFMQNTGRITLFSLGLLIGFGVWVNGLTLVYSIPTVLVLLREFSRRDVSGRRSPHWLMLLIFLIGTACGATPWWIYGLQHGFGALLSELLGSAISNGNMSYPVAVGYRFVSFLLFGLTVIFGVRPPWEIHWLVLPLIPLVVGAWSWILVATWKRMRRDPSMSPVGSILFGIILTTMAGFILTSFGNDPSGRYFLPLAIPLAIFAGILLDFKRTTWGPWRWALLALLLGFNLGGTIQCWLRNPPGFTTQFDSNTLYRHAYDQDLIDFLKEHHLTRGYTTYWITYPLAFLTNEEFIFIPSLPYHLDFSYTMRDDRYPPYDALVAESNTVSYITANQSWLDDWMISRFSMLGINYQEEEIGDFHIFYSLSRQIAPSELGLPPVQ